MVVLNAKQFQIWRSQFVTFKEDRKGLRCAPMVFADHGVVMLSGVLNSPRAVQPKPEEELCKDRNLWS
jgi:hypothetical protein